MKLELPTTQSHIVPKTIECFQVITHTYNIFMTPTRVDFQEVRHVKFPQNKREY
jgi:hypothetical protein